MQNINVALSSKRGRRKKEEETIISRTILISLVLFFAVVAGTGVTLFSQVISGLKEQEEAALLRQQQQQQQKGPEDALHQRGEVAEKQGLTQLQMVEQEEKEQRNLFLEQKKKQAAIAQQKGEQNRHALGQHVAHVRMVQKELPGQNVHAAVLNNKMINKPFLPSDKAHNPKLNAGGGKKEILEIALNGDTVAGTIRIVLRPDWSAESVEYVKQLAHHGCMRCNLYRSEKDGILQGVMKTVYIDKVKVKGACPPGFEDVKNECPDWDKQCGCHGPIMERGHVGWAAGGTGPDFFIDGYKQPARFWGTQHTNWGKIEDDASFAVLKQIWAQPVTKKGGLQMLDKSINFNMTIVSE